MTSHIPSFPADFVWGAGSSSYQIEGAVDADGRGPSVWDVFCTRPGAVVGGETGVHACDHYHRYQEDCAIMGRIGLKAYRFSVAWPRIFPDGTGTPNRAGLDFYSRLVDAMLAQGVQPWLTLFHWDMPQALQNRGGWLNRDSVQWFTDYAAAVTSHLADRVGHWMTLNEPQIYINLGHATGVHAPGLKLSMREQLLASHHTLMAHGSAVRAMRTAAKRPVQIGWAPVGRVDYPVTEHPDNVAAARRSTFSVDKPGHWTNTWFADPVIFGHYPEDGLAYYGAAVPRIRSGDMEMMCPPLDFYGLNIYSGAPVRAGPTGQPEAVPHPPGMPLTAFRWPVTPECLYWGPKFIAERYKLPVVVTENGMSNLDWPDVHGHVNDPQRIDFTRRYLLALSRAVAEGVPVQGYFHWSLLDNFEWAEGYKERFGLVHVDYATQKRTLKASAHWYARVIATGGASLVDGAVGATTVPKDAVVVN